MYVGTAVKFNKHITNSIDVKHEVYKKVTAGNCIIQKCMYIGQ